MNSPRMEILNRIGAHQRKSKLPQVWQSKNKFDDLGAQFAKSLIKVKGEVFRVSGLDEAWKTLDELLRDLDAKKGVAAGYKPLTEINLRDRFPSCEWFLVGQPGRGLREFCESADVGITGADIALAETGSILLYADSKQSRVGSLLPPVHIVMLPASKLIPDIFVWTAQRKAEMPSQMVMISGPSKTADIEQTLVVGVHGPKRFIVILYQD